MSAPLTARIAELEAERDALAAELGRWKFGDATVCESVQLAREYLSAVTEAADETLADACELAATLERIRGRAALLEKLAAAASPQLRSILETLLATTPLTVRN